MKISDIDEASMRQIIAKSIEATPEFINGSIQGRAGNILSPIRAPFKRAQITNRYAIKHILGESLNNYCVSMAFAGQGGIFNFDKVALVSVEKAGAGYEVKVHDGGSSGCGNRPTTDFVELIRLREASIKKNPNFFEGNDN